jgi:hypothetical protein
MGQRQVDATHKWDRDQICKGCGAHLHEPKATVKCEKPFDPPPHRMGEPWGA